MGDHHIGALGFGPEGEQRAGRQRRPAQRGHRELVFAAVAGGQRHRAGRMTASRELPTQFDREDLGPTPIGGRDHLQDVDGSDASPEGEGNRPSARR